MALDFSTLNFK